MQVTTKEKIKNAGARFWSMLPSPRSSLSVRAAILCYHSVSPHRDMRYDPISPDLFEAHLDHLRLRCNPVSMDELVDAMCGAGVLPERAVAVTLDDGYLDNFEHAFPLLVKYRVPATIYVVTGFVNGEVELASRDHFAPLDWEQMRIMQRSGLISFGAHTCTHRILSMLDDREVEGEIVGSRRIIEMALQARVRHFAYPNGRGQDIPPSAPGLVERLGFDSACSTIWGSRHRIRDRFMLNRIMITGADSVPTLARKIAGDYDYLHWLHRANAVAAGHWRRPLPRG